MVSREKEGRDEYKVKTMTTPEMMNLKREEKQRTKTRPLGSGSSSSTTTTTEGNLKHNLNRSPRQSCSPAQNPRDQKPGKSTTEARANRTGDNHHHKHDKRGTKGWGE